MSELGVALEVTGISKRFGAVEALCGVDITIRAGEVHALVGENGAGKSTLINILAGTMPPDAGTIALAGQTLRFRNSHDALTAGIAAVFQELSLVGTLSVAENIFANRQPVNRLNLIRGRELRDRTRQALRAFDVVIDPDVPVERLSPAERQVVEIVKAASANPCVMLLDEPTSSLTHGEKQRLFRLVRHLRSQGVAIVYISHHLPEVLELADRVTVLRDGRHVATRDVHGLTEDDLVTLMVGRELRDIYGRRSAIADDTPVCLRVEGLTRRGAFEDVSLQVRRGEIVGLAGLVGAGRTDLGRAIFGAEPADSGSIQIDGRPVHITTPTEAMRAGIAYVSEDRKELGLYLRHTVRENLAAPRLERFCTTWGAVRDGRIDEYARKSCKRFGVVTPDVHQIVGRLSGGNQQKVLLATWMGIQPKVLIADEPTRGVDVGARSEIYAHLRRLAAGGAGVVLISSDLQEILGMSDRVLVMRAGRIAAGFDRADATEEAIIAAALGTAAQSGQAAASTPTSGGIP